MFANSISATEVNRLEQINFEGKIEVIDALDKNYNMAIEYLLSESIVGFDTETKPCFVTHTPRNKTAILQLSGSRKAFIFRLPSIGLPKELTAILEKPSIIKVGAAVNDDINGLKKYGEFTPNSFIDLQTIAEKFGIKDKSVKKMAAIILQKKVSKSQQLSNWESSKLSEAQLRYAATDAWVCRQMYIKLMESND